MFPTFVGSMAYIQAGPFRFERSPKRALQNRKVAVIVLCWCLVAVLLTIYDHVSMRAEVSLGPTEDYSFWTSLFFNLGAGFMGGLMGGMWLVYYVNEELRDKPYWFTLLIVMVSFLVIVGIISIVLGFLLVRVETGLFPFISHRSTDMFVTYLRDPLHLKNALVWANITLLTQFFLQVSDKFGPGLLWDFIRGRYQTPQTIERVFMFLDLTNSTTIAEELGNKRYYELLRDFFADMTDPILEHAGRIYQYVGDEVVISWRKADAVKSARGIRCYFAIREKIASKADRYQERYGSVPDFKAAIHVGEVTAGEIGIIKRDITYSGDVLNTTARLLSRCHHHKEKLLISGDLREQLHAVQGFAFKPLGVEQLRGRVQQVQVFGVEPLKEVVPVDDPLLGTALA